MPVSAAARRLAGAVELTVPLGFLSVGRRADGGPLGSGECSAERAARRGGTWAACPRWSPHPCPGLGEGVGVAPLPSVGSAGASVTSSPAAENQYREKRTFRKIRLPTEKKELTRAPLHPPPPQKKAVLVFPQGEVSPFGTGAARSRPGHRRPGGSAGATAVHGTGTPGPPPPHERRGVNQALPILRILFKAGVNPPAGCRAA